MKLIAFWFLLSAADRSADVLANKTKAKEMRALALDLRQKAQEETHLAENLYQQQVRSTPPAQLRGNNSQLSALDEKVLAELKGKQRIASGEEADGVKALVIKYSEAGKNNKEIALKLALKGYKEDAQKVNEKANEMNRHAAYMKNLYRILRKAEDNDSKSVREAKLVVKQHRKNARKLEEKARKVENVADRLEIQGSVLKYVKKGGLTNIRSEEETDPVDLEVLKSYGAIIQEIKSETCLIYGRKRCPWCTKAKQLLEKLGVRCKKIDLDSNVRDEEIKNQVIMAYTDQRSVPNIFVKQTHIGGFSRLKKLLQHIVRSSPKAPQDIRDDFNVSSKQAPRAA